MAFDEQAYLAANPDVAAHVAAGGGSALDHYTQYGQAEGRRPVVVKLRRSRCPCCTT